jgi:hypothetical protein
VVLVTWRKGIDQWFSADPEESEWKPYAGIPGKTRISTNGALDGGTSGGPWRGRAAGSVDLFVGSRVLEAEGSGSLTMDLDLSELHLVFRDIVLQGTE